MEGSALAKFCCTFPILPGDIKKNHENLNQNRRFPGTDKNLGRSEYKTLKRKNSTTMSGHYNRYTRTYIYSSSFLYT
jgi:hypothetical protein